MHKDTKFLIKMFYQIIAQQRRHEPIIDWENENDVASDKWDNFEYTPTDQQGPDEEGIDGEVFKLFMQGWITKGEIDRFHELLREVKIKKPKMKGDFKRGYDDYLNRKDAQEKDNLDYLDGWCYARNIGAIEIGSIVEIEANAE